MNDAKPGRRAERTRKNLHRSFLAQVVRNPHLKLWALLVATPYC